MNYKELLNRYKKGLVNEEERQLIEEEIDKQEAFEEYISETLDEEFNDFSKVSNNEIFDEETTKLKKSVNNKLRKVVLTSVLIIVLLYIGIFYIFSGVLNQIYYNPTAVIESEKQEYQSPDFYFDMQAYISLNMPGYSNNSFTSQKANGFGNYEVSYSMRDLFTKNEERSLVDISRGKLTYAMDGIFSSKNRITIWEGFEEIKNPFSKDDYPENEIEIYENMRENEYQRKNEETIRYLNELNPLSYISMSIVFNEDLTMEEYYHMSKEEYPSINFKWVGIRTVDPGEQWSETQPMHLIGFNPNLNDEPSSINRPDPEKYPIFYLTDMRESINLSKLPYPKAISEAYEIHFRSRLEYLSNRDEFVKIFDYNYFKTDFYDNAIAYIDENGVKTYGVLAYGTAAEFLEYVEEISYDSIYINQVLPTKPNIYYD